MVRTCSVVLDVAVLVIQFNGRAAIAYDIVLAMSCVGTHCVQGGRQGTIGERGTTDARLGRNTFIPHSYIRMALPVRIKAEENLFGEGCGYRRAGGGSPRPLPVILFF